MKIIFTICSNNYLAQAKALGDSIIKSNPEYVYYIGLVDQYDKSIDYEKEIGHKILLCEEIGIKDFESLYKKYNIIELNTCVKPFFLKYFTEKHTNLEYLMYFDPDTFVFGNLLEIEKELTNGNEIILTPHILTPIPLDNKTPHEHLFLNFGIYNLGFIGIKNPADNIPFFDWWGEKTYNLGFDKVTEGLFVDQLWLNFAPIYYPNVVISKHFGLNMAPWNLHERKLTKDADGKIKVNGIFNLIFYHFSNYKSSKPEVLANHYNRFSFNESVLLKDLYNSYLRKLLANNIEQLSIKKCAYVELREAYLSKHRKNRSLKVKVKETLKRFLR